MGNSTFQRHELKYMLTGTQYEALLWELKRYMVYDEFCKAEGTYGIYNIYFDTKDDELIRKSISKPYFKEKIRLRSYRRITEPEDTVFLELKRKVGGVVAKRRAAMTYIQAMEFMYGGRRPNGQTWQDRQVTEEISEFLNKYEVVPKVYISYDRSAFFDKEDSAFRVSFDQDILTRRKELTLHGTSSEYSLLGGNNRLMEVKCMGAIPLWFCEILSREGVYRTNFSKYGEEYKRFVEEDRQIRRAAS